MFATDFSLGLPVPLSPLFWAKKPDNFFNHRSVHNSNSNPPRAPVIQSKSQSPCRGSLVGSSGHNKFYRPGLKQQTFISHSSGGWKAKVRRPAWSDSRETLRRFHCVLTDVTLSPFAYRILSDLQLPWWLRQ